ncbi:MAG: addiction module toxin [Deltaproteobacteria bacterium RIFCSPLOWO2_02_FULL_44_10]|nr:MAG: addiction module toxin [Deltaproteobacteria bacterium RIFCSPHIGHO2_02_FULL_44_16]OGQ46828.1 MAG: addiction module toxin [Deltaproteobacteria bacterium RIFCSPLOWO2_02_FULL_44_10]
MYIVFEHKSVEKSLKKTPLEIRKNYLAWKRIIELEGPQGLRFIKGFHDEALKGEWQGFRSSRLNKQWRVIYKIDKEQLIVYVVEINPHTY